MEEFSVNWMGLGVLSGKLSVKLDSGEWEDITDDSGYDIPRFARIDPYFQTTVSIDYPTDELMDLLFGRLALTRKDVHQAGGLTRSAAKRRKKRRAVRAKEDERIVINARRRQYEWQRGEGRWLV